MTQENKRKGIELSIPGISHANQRGGVSTTRKGIWLCFFSLGLALTGYQVITVVEDYWKYPVRTTISVEDQSMQPLPAITICSYNKIRCQDLIIFMYDCYEDPTCPESRQKDLCTIADHTGCGILDLLQGDKFATACSNEAYSIGQHMPNPTREFLLAMKAEVVDEIYSYLNPDERTQIGMKIKNMLLKCTIGKRKCSEVFNITEINTIANGNCFTFNGGGEIGSVRSGPSNGMHIELKLNRDEYSMAPDNQKEGIRAVIHDPSHYPLVEDDGYDVQAKTMTNFGLEVINVTRQPNPHPSQCINKWFDTKLQFFRVYNEELINSWLLKYTMTSCSRICILRYIMKECDCVWSSYDDFNMREFHRKKSEKCSDWSN